MKKYLILSVVIVGLSTFVLNMNKEIKKEEKESNNGFVTLWFDDALLSTYEIAYPLLEEKGWKAVVAVVADYEIAQEKFLPDGDPVMSWTQLEELSNVGWEISNHSMTHSHLNDITDEVILKLEIASSKKRLEDMGFEVNSFSFPYGENGGSKGQEMVEKNYLYWRSSVEHMNPIPASRHITCHFLTVDIEKEKIEEWITEAEETQKWLVIGLHAIVEQPSNPWQHTKEQFLVVLNEIEKSNLEVILPHEIYQRFDYAKNNEMEVFQ